MVNTRNLLIAIFISLLVLVPSSAFTLPALAQAAKPGPATDIIVIKRVPQSQAVEAIKTGSIDVYLYGLRPIQAQQLMGLPNIKLYTAPSGIVDIILNPAPVAIVTLPGNVTKEEAARELGVPPIAIARLDYTKNGTIVNLCVMPKSIPPGAKVRKNGKGLLINPFCFREIRFAMNYLIDRDYIVNTIYKGFALPMYAPYSSADPTYTAIIDLVAAFHFTYNPTLADNIVTKILTEVGAVKKGGVWYYGGKPITVYGIIRTEDERREIGDLFAAALQRLGFNVVKEHLTFRQAIPKVYFTDPFDFEWSFYTEGWGKGALDRWDPWTVTQFCAPWFGFMPGWQESGYWQYKNDTIDKLTETIALGGFKSKKEFIEDLRKAVKLCEYEAIRIWIATPEVIQPARADLRGVTLDLGAGLRSVFDMREWYIPGKNKIVVGHLWVWTPGTVWNPFGGFTDVYSVDPAQQTWDYAIARNPFNGEPMPMRTPYTVRTAGPNGKLPVPDDAVWFDASKNEWVPAHELGRTEATSVVTFDLSKVIGYKFHDNSTITWGDVLAYIAEWIDITYDKEKSKLESAIASSEKPILDKVVAIRILPDQKKLEVYINYWHFDPNYIADYAATAIPVVPVNPAVIIAMQDYLAFVKKSYALSDTRSRAQKIPQLNLVLSEQAPDFKKALEALRDMYDEYKGYFTVNGKVYLTKDEWEKEIDAALKFINTYGHAWISNGPFFVAKFDKDAQVIELKAFRNGYPFTPGTWYFGMPRKTVITNVLTPVVAPGKPATITVYVKGIPPIHVLWLLRDPVTGKIIAKGVASPTPAGTFVISLPANITSELSEYSAYELDVLAYSSKVTLPYEYVATLQTGAKAVTAPSAAVTAVQKQVSQLRKQLSSVTKEVASVTQQVSQLQSRIKTLEEVISGLKQSLGAAVTKGFSTVSSTLSSLASSVSKLSSLVQQLSTSVSTLAAQVQKISSAVSSLEAKVGQATQQASAAAAKAGSAYRAVSGISASIEDLKSSINGLRSLLLAAIGLIVIAIILSIIAIIVARRR